MRKLGQAPDMGRNQDGSEEVAHKGQSSYSYGIVNQRQIGEGWLESRQDQPMPIDKYRENLFAALKQARDKYVHRVKQQKGVVPRSLLSDERPENLKTIHPEIPNFASDRHALHKVAGVCVKTQYTRFFTVDQENLKYYVDADASQVKKTLELKDSEAFIQKKASFMEQQKKGKVEGGQGWVEPNCEYRIGIKLTGRQLKPLFFYSESMHDAKFLLVNIRLYGNQFKTLSMSTMIEMSYLYEKATRLASVMRILCFAKEKRFVQMHGFQELAIDMVEIANQAKMFRKQLTMKWFTNMLGEDEKPTIRSGFRSANPQPVDQEHRLELNEKRINRHMQKLKTFMKNREINRQPMIAKEINKQIQEESNGIQIETLQMDAFNSDIGNYQNVLSIFNGQSSLIFDSDQNYKFMILENKSLDPVIASATTSSIRKRQAENLIRKVNIGDISFISTDLDQSTQFDFNNKINKQNAYTIRLYGRMVQQGDSDRKLANIVPTQGGLDVLRSKQATHRVAIKQIKFPSQLSNQADEKMTLLVKLLQFTPDARVNSEPHFFESTTQSIKIKGCASGVTYPQDAGEESGYFYVDKLSNDSAERFAMGLVIRMNEKPIPLVCERLLEHETLNSYEQGQVFSYSDVGREQIAVLRDFQNNQYEITFLVTEIKSQLRIESQEREGKRLLVGRYALYNSKPVFVRAFHGNNTVEIVETISKSERKVDVSKIDFLEKSGVNVFKLNQEPLLIKNSSFDWIINLKVVDKRILNAITSKIMYRQTSLQYESQDMKVVDELSSIEGNITVSMIETKGLIVQQEVNRRLLNESLKINPQVEIRLSRMSEQIVAQHKSEVYQGRREVYWGKHEQRKVMNPELVVDLGLVHHSGYVPEQEVQVERSRKQTVVKKSVKNVKSNASDSDKLFIHILVTNALDGQEIGESKIELDELIDPNLTDLAKEFCVCLNRSHLIDAIIQKKISGKSAEEQERIKQEMGMYTNYSGIIRFQTLFQPTRDTSLRFSQLRDTLAFKTPKQLLHFEYLLERSDFDNLKFKIPQIEYNPNNKTLGEDLIGLPELIRQCEGNPKIQNLLTKIQTQGSQMKSSNQQARMSLTNTKISDEVMREIDTVLKFQSPWEKLYVILKLQRKERPFIEQIFFSFKNIWDIYSQIVKNEAFDSLNLNEWFSFIDQISSSNNFEEMGEIFELAHDAEDDKSEMDRSAMNTNKSVSFVGEMVKQMNKKAAGLKRQSTLQAKQAERGETENHNFSLVLAREWEKEGNQTFTDLVQLIKCGVPSILRTVVWSDLMRSNLIELEERKNFTKNFPKKFNKSMSTFGNFQDISQKYDSIAFRQIDQDISDFKFPAYYFEESMDQNAQVGSQQYNNMPQSTGAVNRINKLKHDKQQMRKLLRVLLVWGKNFTREKVRYQLCYPTGFLKVVHRFINLMSVEDAFWILIGFIRQYPRLWCLQESSMLDDAKSNFRFEMTCFKAILEAHFPEVSQKLYQVGIAVESLVYESMTSLYSNYFHSGTLLRIWDQMIFYFNTNDQSSKRRGIWLILAPALLIIKVKQQQIISALSAKEIIDAYNDGCAINYNPNSIISMLNELIDDVFVTAGKDKEPVPSSDGGTGSGMFGLFRRNTVEPKKQQVVLIVDKKRQEMQKKQNIVFNESRFRNKVVSDFLFKSTDEAKNLANVKQQHPQRRDSDDSMAFGDEVDKNSVDDGFGGGAKGLKPQSHQCLDYRRWRLDMIPAIQNQFLMTEEVADDDLHEFEDKDIYQKQNLDVKVLHIYLHTLDSWYGTDDETSEFRVQIQYGRLHANGKFEVKSVTKKEDDSIRSDSALQFFHNFKYHEGYNFVKVKIMKVANDEKVCHCYIDIRGHPRGKFIYFQKTMNAKEYTQNAESQFPLTQLKMSLFLEAKKEKSEDQIQQNTQDQEVMKMTYLYSLKKHDEGLINIYRNKNEQFFQKMMTQSLQKQVEYDYQNFKQYLQQEVVIDILNTKYNYTEILPKTKFGHLSLSYFKNFIEKCMPEYANVLSIQEFNKVYIDFISSKAELDEKAAEKDGKDKLIPKKMDLEGIKNFVSRNALLDTNNVLESLKTFDSNDKDEVARFFSLRSFVFTILFQSPITVKEKLDILYDITDMCNKFVDGIDLNAATMIYHLVLQQHLYFLPFNELRAQVENVFNRGEICGIVGAFWTRKMASEIKYDMRRDTESGVYSLEDFLNDQNEAKLNEIQRSQKFSTVDISKEFQETFAMYQNMFGNKVLDFNDDTSPFNQLNNIFASTGKSDLGDLLAAKTRSLGEGQANRYRLCLLSQIAGGERVLTEIRYDLAGGCIILSDEQKPNEENKFKRFFMRNINILNLQGNSQSLGKLEFIEGSMKMPFVYDLMRAETFWQDRKLDRTDGESKSAKSVFGQNVNALASLKMKKKFLPVVNVFVSDRDKIFIFKFENRTMSGRTDQTTVKELVPKQIFLFEIEALFLEDIVLDMRDRIVTEISKIAERGMELGEDFINEIEGKMEFFVRKIYIDGKANPFGSPSKKPEIELIQDSVVGNTADLKWVWNAINDFDRIEKFSDDEVHEDEVVFKLATRKGAVEEVLDEKPKHLLEGYDCFSIYKHADNSYEWRLCKIVGKELKPEFKQQSAVESFLELGSKYRKDVDQDSEQIASSKQQLFGNNYRMSVHESDQYFYYLEFQHLKLYGREMWCKRRREDIIFSARYSRDSQSFEANCYKFIMDTYGA